MKFLILFTLSFFSLTCIAQDKHIQLSFGLSPTAYKGDLNNRYSHFGFGWNTSLDIINNKFASSSIQVSTGTFTGNKLINQLNQQPLTPFTYYFKTSFFSFNYALNFNFIRTKHFHLSLSPGIGLLRFTSKDADGNKLIDQVNTRDKDESYTTSTFILPISLSGKYIFKNNMSVQLAIKWLSPQTDYIDNISTFGTEKGNDKIMQYQFSIGVPLPKSKKNSEN